MRIGIDLLWVRPGIVGGTESFIRNLMQGFGMYDKENEYVLFTAKDNEERDCLCENCRLFLFPSVFLRDLVCLP